MALRDLMPWSHRSGTPARGEEENPFVALQQSINRVFEDFWRRFEEPGAGFGAISLSSPRTDVAETDKEIEVTMELPGLDEKDIELTVTGDMLTVKGEKKQERKEEQKGWHLSERAYGSFYRSIPLPPGIETDKATAEFKKGVLTVRLPKSEQAQRQRKRIEVKGG